ncbi:MAG: hypothetical protein KKF48_05705 [Nanoarchaeota archaeon]|nr:hypothetical protein [Nanoarchaeota archaeon]
MRYEQLRCRFEAEATLPGVAVLAELALTAILTCIHLTLATMRLIIFFPVIIKGIPVGFSF